MTKDDLIAALNCTDDDPVGDDANEANSVTVYRSSLKVLQEAAENWLMVLEMADAEFLAEVISSIDVCFNDLEETGSDQHKKEKAFIRAIQKQIMRNQSMDSDQLAKLEAVLGELKLPPGEFAQILVTPFASEPFKLPPVTREIFGWRKTPGTLVIPERMWIEWQHKFNGGFEYLPEQKSTLLGIPVIFQGRGDYPFKGKTD